MKLIAMLVVAALAAGCATTQHLELSPEEAVLCTAAKEAGDPCLPFTMTGLMDALEGMYARGRAHGAELGYVAGMNSCKKAD